MRFSIYHFLTTVFIVCLLFAGISVASHDTQVQDKSVMTVSEDPSLSFLYAHHAGNRPEGSGMDDLDDYAHGENADNDNDNGIDMDDDPNNDNFGGNDNRPNDSSNENPDEDP